MYLTPKRIEAQIKKADKLMRIMWRLYSPYRSHRKYIVKASSHLVEAVEILEKLAELVKKDFKEELEHPLKKKSIPPGYYNKEDNNIKQD